LDLILPSSLLGRAKKLAALSDEGESDKEDDQKVALFSQGLTQFKKSPSKSSMCLTGVIGDTC
jgi:hypothetical protein